MKRVDVHLKVLLLLLVVVVGARVMLAVGLLWVLLPVLEIQKQDKLSLVHDDDNVVNDNVVDDDDVVGVVSCGGGVGDEDDDDDDICSCGK